MTEWWEWAGWAVAIIGGLTGATLGVIGFFRTTRAEVAAVRSADALEEANRVRLAENPPEKPPWSEARWVSGEVFAVVNESARVAVVTDVEPDVDRFAGLLRHRRPYPARVDVGDNFEVMAIGTMAGRPNPVIVWHWEGDEHNVQRTRRGVAKQRGT